MESWPKSAISAQNACLETLRIAANQAKKKKKKKKKAYHMPIYELNKYFYL